MEEILALAKRYTDSQRLAYEKRTLAEVFPKTQMEFVNGVSNGHKLPADCDLPTHFGNGEGKAVVVLDGVEYETTNFRGSPEGTMYLGNWDKKNGTGDTGEPFVIQMSNRSKSTGVSLVYEIDTVPSSAHTVQIFSLTTELKKIDPKFLPTSSGGGGLETVTISTPLPISGEEVSLSAEDAVLLETAIQKDMPFAIEYANSDDGTTLMYYKAVALIMKNSDKEISGAAVADFNGTTVFGRNDASTWIAVRVVGA